MTIRPSGSDVKVRVTGGRERELWFVWVWRPKPQPPSGPGRWGRGSRSRTILPRPRARGERLHQRRGPGRHGPARQGLVAPREAEDRRKVPRASSLTSPLPCRPSGRGQETVGQWFQLLSHCSAVSRPQGLQRKTDVGEAREEAAQ